MVVRFDIKMFTLLAGLFAASFSNAYAENNSAKLAIYDYPPLYHISGDDSLSGSIGETVKEMCAIAGINCNTQFYPISRAYEAVIQGKSDITFSSIHPRFDECCLKAEWEYPWSSGLFALSHFKSIPKSEEEMIGKKIIFVNGWRSPYRFIPNLDALEKEGKLVVYRANDIPSAIKMLDRNRASLLWGSIDFLWHIKNLKMENRFHYEPRVFLPITIWVHKSKPKILKKLNDAFLKLKKNEGLEGNNLLSNEILNNRIKLPKKIGK